MTAEVIILKHPPEQYYMSCDKCGYKEWALVCEGGRIVQFVCANYNCNAVYDLRESKMTDEIREEEMVIMEDNDGNETCEFLSDVLEEEE